MNNGKTRNAHRIVPAIRMTPLWKATKAIKPIVNEPMTNRIKMDNGIALVVRKEPRNKDNNGLSLTARRYGAKFFIWRFIVKRRSHSETWTFSSHWKLLWKRRKFSFSIDMVKSTALRAFQCLLINRSILNCSIWRNVIDDVRELIIYVILNVIAAKKVFKILIFWTTIIYHQPFFIYLPFFSQITMESTESCLQGARHISNGLLCLQ